MKRALALMAVLALALALPGGAAAKDRHHNKGHKAKVFKGSFSAVGADGAYSDRKFGKAQLVDGRSNDKLSVHVRKLAPKTVYSFALYRIAKRAPVCSAEASGGEQLTEDFPPKAKQTNRAGNFNAKQRSKTFKSEKRFTYFVLVSTTNPDGSADQAVACAKLRRQGKHGHGRGRGDDRGSKQDKQAKGRGRDRKADRRPEDKGPQGRGRGPRG